MRPNFRLSQPSVILTVFDRKTTLLRQRNLQPRRLYFNSYRVVLNYTARDCPEMTRVPLLLHACSLLLQTPLFLGKPSYFTASYHRKQMFAQDSDFAKLVPNSYQDTLAYRLCTLTSGCGALYIIGLTYYVREHSSVHGIPAVFTPSRSSHFTRPVVSDETRRSASQGRQRAALSLSSLKKQFLNN